MQVMTVNSTTNSQAVIRIADTESDGLAEEATVVWCASCLDYDAGEDDVVHFGPSDIDRALGYLHDCDVIVMHNAIGHDLPLLKKLHDWEPLSHQIVIDTLVYSRMLYPQRPMPQGVKGCGTHSIEAWGARLGFPKPAHEDWTQYSDDMRVRCNADTIINRMVLKELERESEEQEMFYHKAKR